MQNVEEIAVSRGFLGGTSNFLIKTLAKVGWDVLIDIDKNTVEVKHDYIRSCLVLSKTDKDFINTVLSVRKCSL